MSLKKTRILFVCMGNICRSPTAEAVARHMAQVAGLGHRFEFDSAGTHGYHIGDPPDRRAIIAGARRGYDLAALRARKIDVVDFGRFDLVLAMDDDNHEHLLGICPPDYRHRLKRLLDFAPHVGSAGIPDPYFGDAEGFDIVIDLAEEGIAGLIASLR